MVEGWAVSVPMGYRVGRWVVTEPIATGNFGSVYAARPADSGGPEVALKFLATGAESPRRWRQVRELAEREADFGRRVSHPRLVTVAEALAVSDPHAAFDGAVVLVMERAAGSAQDVLDGRRAADPEKIITQVREGLAFLHGAGWVHGDLKPSNILLDRSGSALLADFGLVTPLEGTHGYGPPLGSVDYLPPERWREGLDERGVRVRPSADLWALGVTAHQLLTGGAHPFPGGTPAARLAAAQEYADGRARLRLSPDLTPRWREFITGCLAPDAPEATSVVERRRRLPLVAASAAAAVLAAAGVAYWWPGDGRTAAPATVELRVYNVEAPCRLSQARPRECSLGLSLDPYRPYKVDNVSKHRVWHGDALVASCVVRDGATVSDEYGVSSTAWYRVAVAAEPGGYAWLPAVRTRDDTARLPPCAKTSPVASPVASPVNS